MRPIPLQAGEYMVDIGRPAGLTASDLFPALSAKLQRQPYRNAKTSVSGTLKLTFNTDYANGPLGTKKPEPKAPSPPASAR